MGGAEIYRAAGSAPGVEGLDKLYPGGPFDPLEFASDPVRRLLLCFSCLSVEGNIARWNGSNVPTIKHRSSPKKGAILQRELELLAD